MNKIERTDEEKEYKIQGKEEKTGMTVGRKKMCI